MLNKYFPQHKDLTVTAKPHHFCPDCNAPIYDTKPICSICFKNGKWNRYKHIRTNQGRFDYSVFSKQKKTDLEIFKECLKKLKK